MCKSRELQYTEEALTDQLQKLYHVDGFTYPMLADLSGYSESMVRMIWRGDRNMAPENLVVLMRNLARQGNYRLLKSLVLSSDLSIHKNNEVVANGNADDEVIDGGDALYSFRDAHRAGDIDQMDNAISRHEQVLERLKAERAKKAGSA